MKYRIHNDSCIDDIQERNNARLLISKQVLRLERITKNYPKNLEVDFYFNKADRINYILSAIIKLKEGSVFVKEKCENTEAGIYSIFDRLKLALAKRIHKERKGFQRRRRENQIHAFKDHVSDFQQSKKEVTQDWTNHLLRILIEDMSNYVRRRIKTAEMTSAIKKGKFNLQELLNDIYVLAYENMPDIPEKTFSSHAWIYQICDEYLDAKLQELKFEKENLERFESLVEAEYELNKEYYAINADHVIIPLNELDGYEDLSDTYMAEDLFIGETENSLLNEITLKLNQQEIHKAIEKEIAKLPLFKRTIMDLYLIDQMTIEEISDIKRISLVETEAVIQEMNEELKQKLYRIL